jgi:hypothetical protein
VQSIEDGNGDDTFLALAGREGAPFPPEYSAQSFGLADANPVARRVSMNSSWARRIEGRKRARAFPLTLRTKDSLSMLASSSEALLP